jgi:release factor glutamine methyltransferase
MKPNACPPPDLKNPRIEVGAVMAGLRRRLSLNSETPGLDAQVLLAHILQRDRAWILAHPEHALSPGELDQLDQAEQRLAREEPLPYVLGHWEFYGLNYALSPDVLIPRPETELLVETALTWLQAHPEVRFAADVGTGSGCIAVALAANCPDLQIIACDLSLPALRVARQNAIHHNVADRIHLFQGDLLAPAAGPFALVCANLPYIPTRTLMDLPVADHEPRQALDGGPDGLVLVARLLDQLMSRLAPRGLALLEIEATCGAAALTATRRVVPEATIQIRKDLYGLDRLVCIER